MPSIKQVIVLRKDLNMRKGKMVAQGGHAVLQAYEFAIHNTPAIARAWRLGLQTKITLGVDSLEALKSVYDEAVSRGLPAAMVRDAGLTEFKGVATVTAVAIGPGYSELIDPVTGNLSLL